MSGSQVTPHKTVHLFAGAVTKVGDTSCFHIGDARSLFLTSASKFNIEPNGEIFDVNPKNDQASPNVKTPVYSGPKMSRVHPEICKMHLGSRGAN